MTEIVFCLIMLSECLYLWSITRQLDAILSELRELLKGSE